MINKNNISIISGANGYRLNAHLNHEKFSKLNNYNYKFYLRDDIKPPYFIKVHSILESMKTYEYILWVDDDVFFLDYNFNIENIFKKYSEDIIVTRGRGKKSGITLFNNGIIFIRTNKHTQNLFKLMLNTSLKEVRSNYESSWGPMDTLDQSRMIYLSQKKYSGTIKILDYPGFNAHYESFKNKDFINTNPPMIHITSKNKKDKIERFCNTFNVDLF